MNKCLIVEEILVSLYNWNFITFSVSDIFKTLGINETESLQSDTMLINELIWDLVIERIVTPWTTDEEKGQLFYISSKKKLKQRLDACTL